MTADSERAAGCRQPPHGIGVAVQLVAAQSPVPRYEVKRASAPLTIDGKLDEAAWAAAPAVTLQFLWESQTGAKQMTRARLLWDAQALYVGFDADDADITAQFSSATIRPTATMRSRSSSTRTRSRRSSTTASR
jgi:hypothetical protein